MFRMNGTPRAQDAQERCLSISHSARAGAVPLSLAQCLTQGGGESGDRSKGHDLLFSADYADYADYCMRLAWAMRRKPRSGYVQDERYTAGAGRAGAVPLNIAQRPRRAACVSLARCLTQGAGESGDRSKGHDLLFSADYADYADYTDYCMRVAWAKRRSGVYQVSKSKPHPYDVS